VRSDVDVVILLMFVDVDADVVVVDVFVGIRRFLFLFLVFDAVATATSCYSYLIRASDFVCVLTRNLRNNQQSSCTNKRLLRYWTQDDGVSLLFWSSRACEPILFLPLCRRRLSLDVGESHMRYNTPTTIVRQY